MRLSIRNIFGSKEETRATPVVRIDYGETGSTPDDVATITDPLSISAVITCTNKRASTISTMPLMIYKKASNGGYNEPMPDHPLSKLFSVAPYGGNEMSTVDWLHYMMLNYDLHGNSYAQIVRNAGGRIVELLPVPSNCVIVSRNQLGKLVYNVSGLINGRMSSEMFSAEQILHIKNYSTDGIVGRSVIDLARETVFNVASELNNSSRRVAKNTLKTTSILTTPGQLDKEAQASLKAGLAKSTGTIILTNGLTFADRKVNISPEDAQFLQSYQFKQSEIAAMFSCPSYVLNISGDRKPASAGELEAIQFLTDCIRPICERWEASLNLRLLTEEERNTLTFGFDDAKLLRLDSKSQMDFMTRGITAGLFTVNEMRSIAGYPPIEGGDALKTPLNLGSATTGDKQPLASDMKPTDATTPNDAGLVDTTPDPTEDISANPDKNAA